MTQLAPSQLEELLAEARIGRLAMADAAGRPYVIPLPFTWWGGSLYLRLPMTGRKGQVLRQNPQVCFEVDRYSDTLDDYASVLIEGRVETVADLQEKQQVREVTTAKYRQLRRGYRPGHRRQTPLEQMPLCKIIVQQLSGRCREPDLLQKSREPA